MRKKPHRSIKLAWNIHILNIQLITAPPALGAWDRRGCGWKKDSMYKHRRGKAAVMPIRLCDFDTLRDWTCFDADSGKDLAVDVREYFIPDFSNWKSHDAFESAFARLKKDLEAENPKKP